MQASQSIPHQSINHKKPDVGVVPRPRERLPAPPTFEVDTYYYLNNRRAISLPIRPANLNKSGHDKFRSLIKKTVINLEKDNRNTIIVYRRDATWWQCGGNSVLFYKHRLETEYHLSTVSPRHDNDFGCRWPSHIDCFMIKNITNFRAQLESRAHAKLILDTPELLIFELPFSFSETEISALQSIRKNKEDRINTLLLPHVVAPRTRQTLDELHKLTVDRVCQLSEPQRHLYGYTGAELISSLAIDFVAMSNNHIPAIPYYEEGISKLDRYRDWLVSSQKFHLFELDPYLRIGHLATDLRERFINDLTVLRAKLAPGDPPLPASSATIVSGPSPSPIPPTLPPLRSNPRSPR